MDKDFAPKVHKPLNIFIHLQLFFLVMAFPCFNYFFFENLWFVSLQNLQWDPPRLEDVSKDMVDCYFSPATDSDDSDSELKLPTAQREPYF